MERSGLSTAELVNPPFPNVEQWWVAPTLLPAQRCRAFDNGGLHPPYVWRTTMHAMNHAAQTTTPENRLLHVDAIRGLALFGVLLVNLYAQDELALTEEQVAAMPMADANLWIGFVIDVLWTGKAQALFSMLFGFGFALQMQRAEARGVTFVSTYSRRLAVLLAIGCVHLWVFFAFDILHVYAVMGFALLLARQLPTRWLLTLGLALSLIVWPLFWGWVDSTAPDAEMLAPLEQLWQDGIARRSQLFLDSDFAAYARELWHSSWNEYLLTPYGATFFAYVFGRFLIGYWIARRGFLTAPDQHSERFRIEFPILLWGGLLLSAVAQSYWYLPIEYSTRLMMFATLLSEISTLMLACAYALILIRIMQGGTLAAFTRGLTAVGRMALSNYLMQTLVFLFVLYGFGLGALPVAGAGFCVALAVTVFALQIGISRWWLARYRYGPMEWGWRYLTYGRKP